MERMLATFGRVTLCLAWLLFAFTSLQAATPEQIEQARAGAIAWLVSHQSGDGAWRSADGSQVQASAAALRAFTTAGVRGAPYARGLAWLANAEAYSVDALAHQVLTMNAAGMNAAAKLDRLVSWRNSAKAWGTYNRYATAFPDTPLASSAIRTSSRYLSERGNLNVAMCQILTAQKPDGSWAFTRSLDAALLPSNTGAILPTVFNIIELQAFIELGRLSLTCSNVTYSFSAAVTNGINWLLHARLRGDGGFSEPSTPGDIGTAMSTALAYRALVVAQSGSGALTPALDFLIDNQAANGSWGDDALATALVAGVFPATTMVDSDQDGVPDAAELRLGTDPAVYDSRTYATGNGHGVAGTTTAYSFLVERGQSVAFDLAATTAQGTPVEDEFVQGPTGGSRDCGTLQPGTSGVCRVMLYHNTSADTMHITVRLDNTRGNGFRLIDNLTSSLPRTSQYRYTSGSDWQEIASVVVAPNAKLNVDVEFDTAGQSQGLKLATLTAQYSTDAAFDWLRIGSRLTLSGVIDDAVVAAPESRWTVSQGQLPAGMVLDATTGRITGTPIEPGTYNFVVTVFDAATGQTRTYHFQIVVNSPPTLAVPAAQMLREGDVIDGLSVVASDADRNFLSYRASSLPAGLRINPATGAISGTLSFDSAGTHQTTLVVSDGIAEVSGEFSWVIAETPRAPTLRNPVFLRNDEGDTVAVQLDASDADGDALTFSATGLPPGLSINASGTIFGTIGYDAATSYNVIVSAGDGTTAATTASFVWEIGDVNRAPTLQPVGMHYLHEGEVVTIELHASDPDGDALRFSVVANRDVPFGDFEDHLDGTATLAFAPGLTDAGEYSMQVEVTDVHGNPLKDQQPLIVVVLNRSNATDVVRMETPLGAYEVELFGNFAPGTVGNFLNYVAAEAFDNSFIHHTYPGTLIQGGWLRYVNDGYYEVPKIAGRIDGEPGLRHFRGTIAMAWDAVNDPDSATSQWFINLSDNSASLNPAGYTVFGQVIRGMNVVDAIAQLDVCDNGQCPNLSRLPLIDYPDDGSPIGSYLVLFNNVTRNELTAKDVDDAYVALGDAPFRAPVPRPIGGTGSYTYSITGGALPTGIVLDQTTGVLRGMASVSGEYFADYTVADTVGRTAVGKLHMVVNRPPTLEPVAAQRHEEGESVAIQLIGGGAEPNEVLEYRLFGGVPNGAAVDAATGQISGTLAAQTAGVYSSLAYVGDGTFGVTRGFSWTVDPASELVFTPLPAYHMAEGDTLDVPLSASGADVICFSLAPSAPSFAELIVGESGSGIIRLTPGYDDAQTYSITVDAMNWCNGSAVADAESQTFTVEVANVNQPPMVVDPGTQTTQAGAYAHLQISATDAEQDVLQYDAIGLPTGLSIDSDTGLITGTIALTEAGSHSVQIGVLDTAAAKIVVIGFTWVVTGNDAAPTAVNDDATTAEDVNAVIRVLANDTDANGDALTLMEVTAPQNGSAIVNSDNTITYTPNPQFHGTDTFEYSVVDSTGLVSVATVNVTIVAVNDPTFIDNPGDQWHAEGDDVQLPIVASDPESEPLLFAAQQLPPGLDIDPMTGVISGTLNGDAAGVHPVTVYVSTLDGADQSSVSFEWTVDNTNHTPIVFADSATTDEDVPISIPVLLNDSDPDNDDLRIVVADGAAYGTVLIDWDGTLLYTPNENFSGVDSFSYSVDDGHGGAAAGTVAVTVTAVNDPPTIAALADQLNVEGATVSLAVSGADVEDDSLTFGATGLPLGLAIDPNSGVIGGTVATHSEGAYFVTISVSDGIAPPTLTRFNWSVKPLSLATTYTVLDPAMASNEAWVVSLSDNNRISVGDLVLNLSRNERRALPIGTLQQNYAVHGDGPFELAGAGSAIDLPGSSRLAGTLFVMPHRRGYHTYYLVSPDGPATASIKVGPGSPLPVQLSQGQVMAVDVGQDDLYAAVIVADRPILVSHKGDQNGDGAAPQDASPVPPAATELWGVRTASVAIGAMEDDTQVTVYTSDGLTQSLTLKAGSRQLLSGSFLEGNGTGKAMRIVADKPIGAVQFNDGDGDEQTAFLPTSQLGIRFGLPLDAQYVAVVCPMINTTVTLFNGSNAPYTKRCDGTGDGPGKAYFGTSKSSDIGVQAGAYIESDTPVYVMYEDSSSGDERNLVGDSGASLYTILDPATVGNEAAVVSLADDNVIFIGNLVFHLDQYERRTVPAGTLTAGMRVRGEKPFELAAKGNAMDVPGAARLAGTLFVIPHSRNYHGYDLISPDGSTTAEIRIGTGAPTPIYLPQGEVVRFSAGANNLGSAVITAQRPILVSHLGDAAGNGGSPQDASPVPPAAQEIWGVLSNVVAVGAAENDTRVTVYTGDGATQQMTLNAGARSLVTVGWIGHQGTGSAVRMVANKPIGAVQFNDLDGADQTAFLPTGQLGVRFGLPVDAQYVAVVCPQAGTTVTLYDVSGQRDSKTCSAPSNGPGKAYFGTSANLQVGMSAGAYLESNHPVHVVYDEAGSGDERNLLGHQAGAFGGVPVSLESLSLIATTTPAIAGGSLGVAWSGIQSPAATDWIAVYEVGVPDVNFADTFAWQYTGGNAAGSASLILDGPDYVAGRQYEIRLFARNGYKRLATSEPFELNAAGTSVIAASTPILEGGQLTVAWSGIANPTPTDWIAVYEVGAPTNPYAPWKWIYTNGAATGSETLLLDMPSYVAGRRYEVRLYAENGDTRLATSPAFVLRSDISRMNNAPQATDDMVSTDEDVPVDISVLDNDIDVDGDALSVSIVVQPEQGQVTVGEDGSLNYTASADYAGADSFMYEISDGRGGVSRASVSITVNAVNDPPHALADDADMPEDATAIIAVLDNDSDVEGDSLTIVAITQGAYGTVGMNDDSTLAYTPTQDFNGEDVFSYTVEDGVGATATAIVNVSVMAVNDMPTLAVPANRVEGVGTQVTVTLDAQDMDGDLLSFSATGLPPGTAVDPAHGVISGVLGDAAIGSHLVEVIVSDAAGSPASETFYWTVTGAPGNAHQYTILDTAMQGSPAWVVSLSDDNVITVGDTVLNLDRYERDLIPAGTLEQGLVVHGEGPFDIGGSADATDVPGAAQLAGTLFVMPQTRNYHTYYLTSPTGDATAHIRIGTGIPVNLPLPQGQVVRYTTPYDFTNSVVIKADRPILVSHQGDVTGNGTLRQDVSPVPPAATELWGVRSDTVIVGAVEDNTTVTVYASDGSTQPGRLNAGQRFAVDAGLTGSHGRGSALRIVADKPIGAVQYGDKGGADQTAFLPTSLLGTRFGIPTDAQYVAVVCPYPDTTVTLHDGVSPPTVQPCSAGGDAPGKAYFGNATGVVGVNAGAFIESDQPIYVVYDEFTNLDERNLLGTR